MLVNDARDVFLSRGVPVNVLDLNHPARALPLKLFFDFSQGCGQSEIFQRIKGVGRLGLRGKSPETGQPEKQGPHQRFHDVNYSRPPPQMQKRAAGGGFELTGFPFNL